MDYESYYNDYDDLFTFPVYCYNRYRIIGVSGRIFNTDIDILNYIKDNSEKHLNMRYLTLKLPNRKIKIYGRDIDFIFNYIKKYYIETI
jgi:hypothetical protein